jgi:hypothetical protein
MNIHDSYKKDTSNTLTFIHFNYFVAGAVCEFLNNVEQHSYEPLNRNWWINCFSLVSAIDDDDTHMKEIILNSVLETIPKKLAILRDELSEVITFGVKDFLKKCKHIQYCNTTHNCGFSACDGLCGVQPCGVCVDCCRCDTYSE